MPEKIVIPFAVAEYTAQFRHPIIKLLGADTRIEIIQAIADAWEPWGFHINNMEVRTQGTMAEQGLSFTLPDKGVSFFIGPTECRFHKDRAFWTEREEILHMVSISRNALFSAVESDVRKQVIVAALHFQPTKKANKTILSALHSPTLAQLNDGIEPKAYATILGWENKHLLLDTSAGYANGIFVRLSMTFDGRASLEQVVQQLYDEELKIFRMLDVAEEKSE